MKRLLALLSLLFSTASAGLIFDNGSGQRNDTLVIQFDVIDSAGMRYAPFDTAFVFQAFGSEVVFGDTLYWPADSAVVELSSVYPRNLMYEYRLRASNDAGDIGAYTWWVHTVRRNNGTDSHKMSKGWYYVNSDGIEDLAVRTDTIFAQLPDSAISRAKITDSTFAAGIFRSNALNTIVMGGSGYVRSDMVMLNGNGTPALNMANFFGATGYNASPSTIGAVTTLINWSKAGYSLAADGLDGVTQAAGSVIVGSAAADAFEPGDFKGSFWEYLDSIVASWAGLTDLKADTATVLDSAGNTNHSFLTSVELPMPSGQWERHLLTFTSGSHAGWSALITGTSEGVVTINRNLNTAPSPGDRFTVWVLYDSTTSGAAWGDSLYLILTRLAEIDVGSGTGIYKDTLYILDSSDSSAIAGVSVTIWPVGGGIPFASVKTNPSGYAVANLNVGIYDYGLYLQGYDLPQPTKTITGNETDTVFAARFLPSVISAAFCQVWGQIISPDTLKGTTILAVLQDSLGQAFPDSAPPKAGSTLLTRFDFKAATRGGTWTIPLIPNADIIPANTTYKFRIYYAGGDYLEIKSITVPDLSSWQLTW